jgi:cytochrome P450
MNMLEINNPDSTTTPKCPIDHSTLSASKTAPIIPTLNRKLPPTPISQTDESVWTVRGYHAARKVLRAETQQAGFNAERVLLASRFMRPPILYLEGEPHREQRRQTARFFTPKATEGYAASMSAFANAVLTRFQKQKRADLSDLSMDMAVSVAGEVIGLTNSLLPGMKRRIEAFFVISEKGEVKGWRGIPQAIGTNTMLAQFFTLDVLPAIRARRKEPREDLISHLIASGYNNAEILTECVTYGAAGMATTREFIAVSAWHLLENAELKAWYLASEKAERYAFLHEILRLEPVIGAISRTAREDVTVEDGGQTYTIPHGSKIRVEVYDVNADETIVGENPHTLCPMRGLADDKAQPMMFGFGDGHHRCPGAYVAIQESDIFLRKLLALPTLRIEQYPTMRYSHIVSGYELRKFMVQVG